VGWKECPEEGKKSTPPHALQATTRLTGGEPPTQRIVARAYDSERITRRRRTTLSPFGHTIEKIGPPTRHNRGGAVILADKVRTALHRLRVKGVDRPITASFGVATFPDDAVDAVTLMRIADRALYTAKRQGRDRIETATTMHFEAGDQPENGRTRDGVAQQPAELPPLAA
jgi:hypothetical protein